MSRGHYPSIFNPFEAISAFSMVGDVSMSIFPAKECYIRSNVARRLLDLNVVRSAVGNFRLYLTVKTLFDRFVVAGFSWSG